MKDHRSALLYLSMGLVLLVAIGVNQAFGQAGSITGKVTDAKTGEDLVGANVMIQRSNLGASSDLDGKYLIRSVAAGSYTLRISFVGYAAKTVSGVTVRSGESLRMDFTLTSEAYTTDEVVVTAEKVLSSESAVLAERKKAATIGDALSMEEIKRTADATSGDALKRVTGLTVVDNKFVFVRGVTDRYNGTTLNGVPITSTDTDVDRKSFAFDLVPSNLLENTVVVKSATPDLPGDFSGGMVQVNTLDFPARRVFRLGLSSSYSSITSRQSFVTSSGGSLDWLGFDSGERAFPSTPTSLQQLGQTLPNTWGTGNRTAPLNGDFNLAYGDRFEVGENDLGVIAALTYSNSFVRQEFTEAPTYVYGARPAFRFEGYNYDYRVLWAGILDLNYKLSGLHKFSIRNSYNQSGQDRVMQSQGANIAGSAARRQAITWDQRSLYLVQLGGEHVLSENLNFDAEWKIYASSSKAEEPDRKQAEYTEGSNYGEYGLGENYRTWSMLNEKTRGASADFSIMLAGAKVKAGGRFESKERTFGINAYSAIPSRDPRYSSLVLLPIDQVFESVNFEPNKFSMFYSSAFTGAYDGTHDLAAGYVMVDLPLALFDRELRIIGGARIEGSDQVVTSPAAIDDPTLITARVNTTDVLPSINVKYSVTDFINLRLAHYQSVNRPEFRELANVLYLDFNSDQNVIGNPDLDRAYVHNYDIRVEIFPGVGEVAAISYFDKSFNNAIEERLIAAPDRYVKTWYNSPSGTNRGWEFEIRKNLGFLGGVFDNFSVTANYTAVSSEIDYAETKTNEQGQALVIVGKRPMQGQSPWTINVGLFFAEPNWGTNINIQLNKFGRRLSAVGDFRDHDVYEEPRDMVDLAASQQILSWLEAKFAVKNLFGKQRMLTTGDTQVPFSRWEYGTAYSLSVSMNLQ